MTARGSVQAKLLLHAMIALLALLLPACAVLTESQVQEVQRFAQAGQEYSAIPGELAVSYGVLLRDNKLLSLCRHQYGSDTGTGVDTSRSGKAWEELKDAYALEHDYSAAGKRMDAALEVIKAYSGALGALVSSASLDTLGKCAAHFGTSVDAAIQSYNTRYRPNAPLPKIGGNLAEAVHGAGGFYIRHRQAQILRETVQRADPAIQQLMADVQDVALQSFQPAFENYEKNFLAPAFASVVNNTHRIDTALAFAVYDDLSRARAGAQLSREAAAAAEGYARAHRALVETTRQRRKLEEAISEISALNGQVCAAKRTKSAVVRP